MDEEIRDCDEAAVRTLVNPFVMVYSTSMMRSLFMSSASSRRKLWIWLTTYITEGVDLQPTLQRGLRFTT